MKIGITALLLSACILTPVYAEDNSQRIAEIEERIEELNQEITDLNAELKELKKADGSSDEAEGFTYEVEGQSYTYLRHEVTDHKGEEYVVFYFEYTNDSGETSSCDRYIHLQVFQDGLELTGTRWIGNEAMENSMKKVQTGTTIEVAFGFKITSKNDVTLDIGYSRDWDPEEYTFTLE